jgi:hypothetical protein
MTATTDLAQTVLQTASDLAPTLAAADTKAAAIIAVATLGLELLQKAAEAQQAGVIPPEQLAGLFLSVGQGVQSTHDQWARMNAADAAASK